MDSVVNVDRSLKKIAFRQWQTNLSPLSAKRGVVIELLRGVNDPPHWRRDILAAHSFDSLS